MFQDLGSDVFSLGFVRFLRFGFSSCSYCAFVFASAQASRDFDVDSGMNLVSVIPIFISLRFLVSVVLVSWDSTVHSWALLSDVLSGFIPFFRLRLHLRSFMFDFWFFPSGSFYSFCCSVG